MEQHNMQPDEFDQALKALDFGAEPQAPYIPAPRQPAPRFELQNVSHMHESIMNWMLANPEKNLGECATAFGITRSWLSVLIHSNLFQARLKEKQDAIFSGVVVGVAGKLNVLADVGVEKLVAIMETTEDAKFIKETTQMALASLGFGAKTGGNSTTINAANVQQNFYTASQADLEAARGRMAAQGAVSPPVQSLPAPGDAVPHTDSGE